MEIVADYYNALSMNDNYLPPNLQELARTLCGEAETSHSPAHLVRTPDGWRRASSVAEAVAHSRAHNRAHKRDEGDAALASVVAEIDQLMAEERVATDVAGTAPTADAEPGSRASATDSKVSTAMPAPPEAVASLGATASGAYRFPASAAPGTAPLRDQLDALMKAYDDSKNDYAAVREAFCAVSIALNHEGAWAPAYRPQPRPRHKSAGKAAMQQDEPLHRDRLVIDLHWLQCRCRDGFGGVLPQDLYAKLLNPNEPFDFVAAAAYATRKLTSHERAVEHFGVSPEAQWQLATLKSAGHANTHREIYQGGRVGTTRIPSLIAEIRAGVGSWAQRSAGIQGEEQAYLNLWAARKMLGPRALTRQVGELAALMAGTTALEQSTVRKKLIRLVKNVPAAA